MDIAQAKNAHVALEKELTERLHEFERMTGLKIVGVMWSDGAMAGGLFGAMQYAPARITNASTGSVRVEVGL